MWIFSNKPEQGGDGAVHVSRRYETPELSEWTHNLGGSDNLDDLDDAELLRSWSVDVSTEEISGGQKQPEVTDADSG